MENKAMRIMAQSLGRRGGGEKRESEGNEENFGSDERGCFGRRANRNHANPTSGCSSRRHSLAFCSLCLSARLHPAVFSTNGRKPSHCVPTVRRHSYRPLSPFPSPYCS